MNLSRRSFFGGAAALLATPSIIRTPGLLMQVKALLLPASLALPPEKSVLLTIHEITRESISLWKNTNAFLQNIDCEYDDQFARVAPLIGTSVRIRLPAYALAGSEPATRSCDPARLA